MADTSSQAHAEQQKPLDALRHLPIPWQRQHGEQGAEQANVEQRCFSPVAPAHLAGRDIVDRSAEGGAKRQEHGPVEAHRARPHDDENADEADQHRDPPSDAHMLTQQRHRQGADPERNGEGDRRRLRQLQIGDGDEVQHGRCQQHQPTDELQADVARNDDGRPPGALDQAHRQQEGDEIAEEHGDGRRQCLHHILRQSIEDGEDQDGDSHQQNAFDVGVHPVSSLRASAARSHRPRAYPPLRFAHGDRRFADADFVRLQGLTPARRPPRRGTSVSPPPSRRGRSPGRRPRSPRCRSPACGHLPPRSARRSRRRAPRRRLSRSRAP